MTEMIELTDPIDTAWCLDLPAPAVNAFVVSVAGETVIIYFGYWNGRRDHLPPRGRNAVALRREEALNFANHIIEALKTTSDLPAK
jgi:hypothetical protein